VNGTTQITWEAVIKNDTIVTGESEAEAGTASTTREPERFVAPDRRAEVRIVQKALPGQNGSTDFFTLELLVGGTVTAQVPTEGYLTDAYWSPDGQYVAVNNRRGNQGDYLWVFSVADGKVLKRADDALGTRWETTALTEMEDKESKASADNLRRKFLMAEGWSKEGALLVCIRAQYTGVGAYDFKAQAVLRNGKLVLEPGVIEPVK
jgi:hypothetical protein